MTQLETAATRYWRMSSHLRALPDQEREPFLMFSVSHVCQTTKNPHERRLLSRLLGDQTAVA